MLPFLDAGLHLAVAIAVLYAVLGATSLSVRLAARPSAPTMLLDQIDAWWRIFPIVTLVLLAYPLGVVALAGLVCALAFLELAPYYPGRRALFAGGAALLALAAAALQWRAPALVPQAVTAAIALLALWLWIRPGAARLVWLLVALTVGAMTILTRYADLAIAPHARLAWLAYLFIVTALNDIGQFVSGKLFGRHRIAPTISPNKTWQGLFGGVVVSVAVSLALGTFLALAPTATLVLYGALLAVGGFLGDLTFSAAKRYLSIKDFSSLIPGHGGILDRVDSLVVTAPLLYACLALS